jgi:hypothetical protein
MSEEQGLIKCHFCDHEPFETYHDLAVHISISKFGHNGGKRWAKSYLAKQAVTEARRIDRRLDRRDQQRIPLTDEQAEARASTRRQLSGAEEYVTTLCLRCQKSSRQLLPTEYTSSPHAWRIKDYLVVNCTACRGWR